jgi:hypothetical protein
VISRLNSAAQIGRLNRVVRRKEAGEAWWLAGGIDPSDCVAAFSPVTAASYADSLVNLTGDDTYDAYEGTKPGWNTTDGWVKTSGGKEYLKTDIPVVEGYSVIVRFSGHAGNRNYVFGGGSGFGKGIFFTPFENSGYFGYGHARYIKLGYSGTDNSGIVAVTPGKAWNNGGFVGNISYQDEFANYFYILRFSGEEGFQNEMKVQAIAFYSVDISSYVAALTIAMNAL